jgi:hypothetical protein
MYCAVHKLTMIDYANHDQGLMVLKNCTLKILLALLVPVESDWQDPRIE